MDKGRAVALINCEGPEKTHKLTTGKKSGDTYMGQINNLKETNQAEPTE